MIILWRVIRIAAIILGVAIILSGLSAIALLLLRVELGEILSKVTFLLGAIVSVAWIFSEITRRRA